MSKKITICVDTIASLDGSTPIKDVLDTLQASLSPETLVNYWHKIGFTPVLLEIVETYTRPNTTETVYLLNFVRKRYSGPVKGEDSKLSEGISLGQGEWIGEATSALFYPKDNVFLMLYNHEGVKEAVIGRYLSQLAGQLYRSTSNNYEIDPIFEHDVLKKIEDSNQISACEFDISIPVPAYADGDATMASASKDEVRRKRITLCANDKNGRKNTWSFSFFKKAKVQVESESEGEITNVRVSYRALDGAMQTVNLMESRKKIKILETRLDRVNQIYTMESKFNALKLELESYLKSTQR